tara:strand:- start:307 stop:600 length:294 start_codon:yes stop_codon:yes gene_type:complete
MAFKMKSHPEGPFEKNYGIKKGGHKKVSTEKFNELVDQNEEFRNEEVINDDKVEEKFLKIKKDLVPKSKYTGRTPQSQMTDEELAAVKNIGDPQTTL